MKAFILRLYIILVTFFVSTTAMAQLYPEGVSHGKVTINTTTKDLTIFSTTYLDDLEEYSRKNTANSLVIINDINFQRANPIHDSYLQNIITNYQQQGFVFLDKEMKVAAENVTLNNINAYKYMLKTGEPLTQNDQISLTTSFKIWDPNTGIGLGSITLHYYSLMFLLAFGLGYLIMTKIFKIDNVNLKYLEPLFTWTLIGTILGARLGHVFFYEPEIIKKDFWSVFLPIQTNPTFKFTGFSGLASHGATIALILTTLYYSYKIIKKNPFWVYDRLGIVVALGGAFVRLGNFFNSEIIGKPVDESSPLAILFVQQSRDYGVTVPRYPTQLLEAGGYFLLFILLWFLYTKTRKKFQQGWLFGLFFIILWAIRFFVEFLKEPQGEEFIQLGNLNTGQVLSIPFMIAGFIIMWYSKKNTITETQNQKPE